MSRPLIEKTKRLLLAERKVGPVSSPAMGRGNLRIALAFPQRYYTAMSNLGFQAVYRLFNEQPDTACERVFLPDPEDREEYRRTETPLFTLESQQPVRSCDVLAFSLPYENDYPNLLEILELSGIPLLKEDRTAADPLIMAGGAAMLMNPEPLADFVDCFFIGEAEVIAGPLTEVLRQGREAGWSREALLSELARLEGVYVPQFYEVSYLPDGRIREFIPRGHVPPRVKRAWLKDLNASITHSSVVTPNTELSDMLLVELSRGCRRGCRFCAGCYTYFPYRVRDGGLLENEAVRSSGEGERIGLVGAAISDYPNLTSLGRDLLSAQRSLSFSSLRVDSVTPELAELVRQSGQRTVTLAPEAGSERMRRIIRKGFSEEEIMRAAEVLEDFSRFRLYFMIGLPGERMEDVRAIAALTKKIRHHLLQRSRGKKGGGWITVSLNSFVPKPATPFQWHPMEEVRSLKEKIQLIKKEFGREKGITVSTDVPKWAYLQNLLSRGDRRMGKLLLAAHRFQGNWPQAYRSVDINPDFFVYRRRDFDETLPWDFIDHGVSKEFLWSEYQEALKEGEEA